MTGTSFQITMFVFLSLLSLSKPSSEPDTLQVTHVSITNQLSDGVILRIHCKSADDDIGVHDLSYGQFIAWSFRKNIWGTTRFYCYLFSRHGNNAFPVWREGICGKHCPWYVRDNGTCLDVNSRTYKPFCYQWPEERSADLRELDVGA